MSDKMLCAYVALIFVFFFVLPSIVKRLIDRKKSDLKMREKNSFIVSQLQLIKSIDHVASRQDEYYYIACPEIKMSAYFKKAIPFLRRESWSFSFVDINGDSISNSDVTEETYSVIKKCCLDYEKK